MCLLAAPWVQLSVSAGNGWPHNALRHHWLMPISCHFRDCKALLFASLTHVSGAIASVQTFLVNRSKFEVYFVNSNERRHVGCLPSAELLFLVSITLSISRCLLPLQHGDNPPPPGYYPLVRQREKYGLVPVIKKSPASWVG